MKKTIGVLVLLVLMVGCKHDRGAAVKSGKEQPKPTPESQKIDYPFAEVPFGNRVIVGRKWTASVPAYTTKQITGVFVEGRKVKLSPYEIGKYEVSYKIWKDVCKWAMEHGYTGLENIGNVGNSEKNGVDIPKEQWDRQPVTNMTWSEAVVWCNALTEMEKGNDAECVYRDKNGKTLKNASDTVGVSLAQWVDKKGYRLPSQAEWEAAARYSKDATNAINHAKDGEEPIYFTINISASGGKLPIAFKELKENTDYEAMKNELKRLAVCEKYFDGTKDVKFEPEIKFTSVVGSKAPNDLGCFDMTGNVTEYCYDWAEFNFTFDKTKDIEENPKGPESPSGDEFAKVIRGGATITLPQYLCVTYINWMEKIDDRYVDTGFRLARTK